MRPEEHYRALSAARAKLAEQGLDYDALDYGDQFRSLVQASSRELTLYFKRLRKQSRGKFRYMVVAERHKSGWPHWHVLLHDLDPMNPVRHKLLTDQWHLGFTHYRLATDARAASYVAKYISKSLATRVRASLGYGTGGVKRSKSIANRMVKREKTPPKKDDKETLQRLLRTETMIEGAARSSYVRSCVLADEAAPSVKSEQAEKARDIRRVFRVFVEEHLFAQQKGLTKDGWLVLSRRLQEAWKAPATAGRHPQICAACAKVFGQELCCGPP